MKKTFLIVAAICIAAPASASIALFTDGRSMKISGYKLVDETALEGWQSGLFYVGYVPKLSSTIFAAELARTAGTCPTGDAAYFVPGSTQPAPGGVDLRLVRRVVAAARAAAKATVKR